MSLVTAVLEVLTSALGHCHVEESAGRFIVAAPEQCPGQNQAGNWSPEELEECAWACVQ